MCVNYLNIIIINTVYILHLYSIIKYKLSFRYFEFQFFLIKDPLEWSVTSLKSVLVPMVTTAIEQVAHHGTHRMTGKEICSRTHCMLNSTDMLVYFRYVIVGWHEDCGEIRVCDQTRIKTLIADDSLKLPLGIH